MKRVMIDCSEEMNVKRYITSTEQYKAEQKFKPAEIFRGILIYDVHRVKH